MIIGIGIDIVDISSFERIFNTSKRFKQRIFTETEIAYCEGKPLKYQHYAARFAAKEAVMKALGTGWDKGVQWKHIEVQNDETGKPRLVLYKKAFEILNDLDVNKCHLSLSHSETQAIAYVLLDKILD